VALDLPTLIAVVAFVSALSGLVLLLSWLQNRSVRALALWAAAFAVGAVGVALIAARGDIPDAWSIVVANAAIATGYGLMWAGVRNFDGRPVAGPVVFGGAVIWLLACQIEAVYASPPTRTAVMAAILAFYSLLSAWEFWRGRNERLLSRLPVILFLLIHAAVLITRIPLAHALPLPTDSEQIRSGLWTFIILEAVFVAFCFPYLLEGIVKERIVLLYRHASLSDPLTGVDNRRAFLERAGKMLQRSRFDGSPAALLLFDLDKFKSVNDTFGHHVGDRVLTAFCGIATGALRPNDLFGRLGGEEFASFLPGASLDKAVEVAERIRARFEAVETFGVAATALAPTVSVGVATSFDYGGDLTAMMMAADRALYDAKAKGRNRVERAGRVAEVQIAPAHAELSSSRS